LVVCEALKSAAARSHIEHPRTANGGDVVCDPAGGLALKNDGPK